MGRAKRPAQRSHLAEAMETEDLEMATSHREGFAAIDTTSAHSDTSSEPEPETEAEDRYYDDDGGDGGDEDSEEEFEDPVDDDSDYEEEKAASRKRRNPKMPPKKKGDGDSSTTKPKSYRSRSGTHAMPRAIQKASQEMSQRVQPRAQPTVASDRLIKCLPYRTKNRAPKRDLIRWTDDIYIHTLLAMVWVEETKDIPIPWEEIAAVVHPGATGEAFKQSLAKLRSRRLKESRRVPPQRPGKEKSRARCEEELRLIMKQSRAKMEGNFTLTLAHGFSDEEEGIAEAKQPVKKNKKTETRTPKKDGKAKVKDTVQASSRKIQFAQLATPAEDTSLSPKKLRGRLRREKSIPVVRIVANPERVTAQLCKAEEQKIIDRKFDKISASLLGRNASSSPSPGKESSPPRRDNSEATSKPKPKQHESVNKKISQIQSVLPPLEPSSPSKRRREQRRAPSSATDNSTVPSAKRQKQPTKNDGDTRGTSVSQSHQKKRSVDVMGPPATPTAKKRQVVPLSTPLQRRSSNLSQSQTSPYEMSPWQDPTYSHTRHVSDPNVTYQMGGVGMMHQQSMPYGYATSFQDDSAYNESPQNASFMSNFTSHSFPSTFQQLPSFQNVPPLPASGLPSAHQHELLSNGIQQNFRTGYFKTNATTSLMSNYNMANDESMNQQNVASPNEFAATNNGDDVFGSHAFGYDPPWPAMPSEPNLDDYINWDTPDSFSNSNNLGGLPSLGGSNNQQTAGTGQVDVTKTDDKQFQQQFSFDSQLSGESNLQSTQDSFGSNIQGSRITPSQPRIPDAACHSSDDKD